MWQCCLASHKSFVFSLVLSDQEAQWQVYAEVL